VSFLLHECREAASLFAAQVLVDLSCGSGLFARRFAKSGRFAGVVATDFSENMLRQAKQKFDADSSIEPRYGPPSMSVLHVAPRPTDTRCANDIKFGCTCPAARCMPCLLSMFSRTSSRRGVILLLCCCLVPCNHSDVIVCLQRLHAAQSGRRAATVRDRQCRSNPCWRCDSLLAGPHGSGAALLSTCSSDAVMLLCIFHALQLEEQCQSHCAACSRCFL